MTSPSRLDEVRRVLDATPPRGSALSALRDPPPAPAPAPPGPATPSAPQPQPTPLPPGAAGATPAFGGTATTPFHLARPVGWAAGLLAVAGIIHLVLLPGHLEQARGIGLYFCAIGAAQVVWALLFALRPTRLLAWIGLVALTVQPLAVYLLTRMVRQPFGDHAEDFDLIGIATGVMEVAAIAPFGVCLARTREPGTTAGRGVVVPLVAGLVAGLAFGGAVYGAGLVAEQLFPWLEEPEAPHDHAEAHDAPVAAGVGEALAEAGLGPGTGHHHG